MKTLEELSVARADLSVEDLQKLAASLSVEDLEKLAEYRRREERKQQQEQRIAEWQRERREFWKAIIVNSSIACAVRGEEPPREVLLAANRAVQWFDEIWGGDFPVDLLNTGRRP